MTHKIMTLFAASLLLLSVLILPGCARRHAAAPYYEPSPGVRLPLNDMGQSSLHRIVVSADSTGTLLKLNGQKMALPQFKAALRQQVVQHPRAAVIIAVSKKDEKFVLLYQEALNAAQEANPQELMISTTPAPTDKQVRQKQVGHSGVASGSN